jgi:NitT/TauT family transport system permease protein
MAVTLLATDENAAPARRHGERPRGLVVGLRLAVLVVFLGLWQLAATQDWIDQSFVSKPTAVFARIWDWISDGSIFTNTGWTLLEAGIGFVIAAIVGTAAGILLARYDLAEAVARPFIDVMNAIPRIALAPLFVLWFGLGMTPKVVLVVSVSAFAFLINAYAGVKDVDPEFIKLARSLGASNREILSKFVMPSVTPWLIAATRLGVAYSFSAAVVGEIISANQGLGFLIASSGGLLDTTGELAALLVLGVVAWGINSGVGALERHLLRWKDAGGGQIVWGS